MLLKPLTRISLPLGIVAGMISSQVGWAATGPTESPQGFDAAVLAQTEEASGDLASICPPSALSRFTRHQIQTGETLDSLATEYDLLPPTLLRLNPGLQTGLTVGQEIVIPPFNGIVVTVPRGQTWDQVASQYQSRADVLFEINGCEAAVPERVFVPGLDWLSGGATTAVSTTNRPLRGYPLPEEAEIIAAYGWQPDSTEEKLVFNTGVTLKTTPGTAVLAAGDGTVAFAGADSIYGNLVVVNHQQGLQTRYANLASVEVTVGETVKQGTALGTVASYAETADSFLFFEVRQNSEMGWVAQDPQDYIPALAIR